MKNFIVRVAIPCMVLSAIATLYSCKKDNEFLRQVDPDLSKVAFSTSSTPSVPYTVSTIAGSNFNGTLDPVSICSAADGSIYVTSRFRTPGIIKLGSDGGYTKYLDFDGVVAIKAGANGSLFFVNHYLGQNSVLDSVNVFKIDKNKSVTLVPVTEKLFNIRDIAIGPDSSIYLAEFDNCRIIKITKQGIQSVFAGKKGVRGYADGPRDKAHFTNPTHLRFGEDGNLWVVDGAIYSTGQRIRKVSKDGNVTTVFTLRYDYKKHNYIRSFAVSKRSKNFDLTPNQNVFFFVSSIPNGNNLPRHNQLFHLSTSAKILTPITGNLPEPTNDNPRETDGPVLQASFFNPTGLTVNPKGIFVADNGGGTIRKIAVE